MKGGRYTAVLFIFCTLLLVGCANNTKNASTTMGSAIITDRTGRNWDVTYARDTYDMNPDFYNFGLGINAIKSIDKPVIIREGESGYPEQSSNLLIFGVNHNNEQRAYSVTSLSRHEVYNDIYQGEIDQYVAVTF